MTSAESRWSVFQTGFNYYQNVPWTHVNPEMAFQCHVLLFTPFSPLKVWFKKKKVGRKGENPMCVCVCLWPTCLRLAVFGGLPVFAKIILEVIDGFYFLPPRKKGKKIAPMRATIETKSERGSGAYQIPSRFITSASWTAAGHFKKEPSVPHRYTVTSIQSDAHQAMDQPSGPVHWSTTSCCRPLGSPTYYRLNHLRLCRVFDIK